MGGNYELPDFPNPAPVQACARQPQARACRKSPKSRRRRHGLCGSGKRRTFCMQIRKARRRRRDPHAHFRRPESRPARGVRRRRIRPPADCPAHALRSRVFRRRKSAILRRVEGRGRLRKKRSLRARRIRQMARKRRGAGVRDFHSLVLHRRRASPKPSRCSTPSPRAIP